MEVSKRLEGIGEYYFSQKLREIDTLNRSGRQIINLGIGSPDLPPHPEVIKVLQQESGRESVHGYQPYRGAPVFREAIAGWYEKWYGVGLSAEDEILPLIGSKEGIMHICMTWLEEGDEALVPDPGYPTYRSAVELAGGRCISYPLDEYRQFQPDFEELGKRDLGKVKIMFANYPHMPTGQLPSGELFERFVAFGKKHGILIVHDNPYSFLLPGGARPMSMLCVKGAKDVVIELNSLSKSHNMAGWRVGMLCGKKEYVESVLRFRSNMDSGMFLPVQLAAARALSLGEDWYLSLNKIYTERRMKAFELLELMGCSFSRDQAGLFAWGRVGDNYEDGFALSDAILDESNVFITPGGIFGDEGRNHVRLSLCASLESLGEALRRIYHSFKRK